MGHFTGNKNSVLNQLFSFKKRVKFCRPESALNPNFTPGFSTKIFMQLQPTYAQIIRLALPISFSLLIPQVSFMANAAFLGRLGTFELEVNSLCSIYYLLLTWMGFGWSNGVMVIMSRRLGANRLSAAATVFGNAVSIALLLSGLLMILTFSLAPLLFRFSLTNSQVIDGCQRYLNIRILSFPLLMLTQLINVYCIATNRTRRLIAGSLAGNLANILFDYLFIFGHSGWPQLGLYGAALGSALGEALAFITMWAVFFIKKEHLPLGFFERLSLKKAETLHTFRIAAPLILQYVFSIGGWLLFFIYIEHLGATQLAASHIIRSVLGITGIGTWALASTCNTMVGNIIGQGKPQLVLRLTGKILIVSFGYALFCCIILNCFPIQFLSIYTRDVEVVQVGLPSLRLTSFSILVLSLGTICFNAVIGSGRTWINMFIEIFCVCSYMVYITVVIEQMRLPLQMAWSSEFVYWGLLFLLSGSYLLWRFRNPPRINPG